MDGISRCVTWAQASNWRLFLHSEAQETRKHFHRRKTDTYLHDILSKLRGHSVTPLYPCHNQTRACACTHPHVLQQVMTSSDATCRFHHREAACWQDPIQHCSKCYTNCAHTLTLQKPQVKTHQITLSHTQRQQAGQEAEQKKKLGMFKIQFDFSVWGIRAIGEFVWMFHCTVQ